MNLLDNAIPFLVSQNTTAAHVIIVGVPGKRIYIWRLFLQSAGTVTVTVKDETTTLCGPLDLPAQDQVYLPLEGNPHPQPWFICTVGDDFIIELDADIQVSGAGLYSIS